MSASQNPSPTGPPIGDRLIEIDRREHPDRLSLTQELTMLTVRELSEGRRAVLCLVSAAIAVGGAGALVLAVTESMGTTPQAVLLAGSAAAAYWAARLGRLAYRGSVDVRTDGHRSASVAVVLAAGLAAVMLATAGLRPDLSDRTLILMSGQALFWLIVGGVYFLAQRVDEASLSIRERLIRLELQSLNDADPDAAAG